jgi:hypothetical protein
MMNRNAKRWMAGVVLTALVATTMAPAAEASTRRYKGGHGRVAEKQVRYRPAPAVRHVYRTRVVHHPRYHRSYDGSGLAFLGGLVLGAVITEAVHSHDYDYVDPYCGVRFSSFEAYRAHLRYHHHPAVLHVIEVRTDDWVDSYRCDAGGHWHYYDTEDWN